MLKTPNAVIQSSFLGLRDDLKLQKGWSQAGGQGAP